MADQRRTPRHNDHHQQEGRHGILPLFLPAGSRQIFAIAARPTGHAQGTGVLVCPAFGEEMNRTRRTVRVLADKLAAGGSCMIYPDLHGTGDSPGDFGASRWQDWLDDLRTAASWLESEGCNSLVLVGIRAGALLAWDLLRGGMRGVRQVVLWQPVLTGKAVITDMLRMQIAAGTPASPRQSVAGLRGQLAAGQATEAVGYTLSPALVQALEATSITPPMGRDWPPVTWIEIIGDETSPTRQPAAAMAAQLTAAGIPVDLLRQPDPPFWTTAEVTIGTGTVERTVSLLAGSA